jgi:hypothetical protein
MKILFENWRRYLEEQAEKIEIEEPEDDEDELDKGCGEDIAGISPRRDVATIAILDES